MRRSGTMLALIVLMTALPAAAQTEYVAIGSAVVAIDVRAGQVLRSTAAGEQDLLIGVAVTGDGRRLLVASVELNRSDRVLEYDAASLAMEAFVEVDGRIETVVASPDGRFAYAVSNRKISVIDLMAHTVVGVVPEGVDAASAAVTPDGRWLYVATGYGRRLVVVDTASRAIVARLALGMSLGGLAISADGLRAYVADRDGNCLLVINTSSREVIATIPVRRGPAAVALARDGRTAYVASTGYDSTDTEAMREMVTGSVSVVDLPTGKTTRTLTVGRDPLGVVVTPDGSMISVADGRSGFVTTIDLRRGVIANIDMGRRTILGIAIGAARGSR